MAPDGHRVYFLIDYAATTSGLVAVDLETQTPRFIASADSFSVVPQGRYKGALIVKQRRAKLAPGYYDAYWLITAGGTDIGLVGFDNGDVDLFLEMQSE